MVASQTDNPESRKGFFSLSYQQLLIIFATVIIWFAFLGHRDLIDPDEGRYAEIPREMVESGDWLTPRLNDLKYFEKPVMHYWLTAGVYTLLDDSNASARLVTALSGFLTAIWCLFIASKLTNVRVGYYSYLICISSLIFVGLGHLITLDMTLTLFLALAIGGLILGQHYRHDKRLCRNWMLFGYAMLAAGTLTKGLVCLVIPGGTILFYSIIFRDWSIWKHLHLGKGFILFLALSAPWFVLVSQANPGYAEFFFIKEHLQRYTSNIHQRSQPFWFFIPVLLLGAAPWITQCFQAIVNPIKQLFTDKAAAGQFFKPKGFSYTGFIWVFCLFTVFFFSLSSSKLIPYILPVFPLLSILIAKQIDDNGIGKAPAFMLIGLAVLLTSASAALPYIDAGDIPKMPDAIARFQNMVWLACAFLFVGSFLCFRWRANTTKALSTLAITSLLSFQTLSWSYQELGKFNSSNLLATEVKPYLEADPELPIYSVGLFSHSLNFYINREITLVNYYGELSMGQEMEPGKHIDSVERFIEIWNEDRQAIAILSPRMLKSGELKDISYKIIYSDSRKVAIARQ